MTDTYSTSRTLLRHLTVAGAAALAGAAANAQIVFTNVNQNVGFAAGDLSSLTLGGLPVSASVHTISNGGPTRVVYFGGMLAIQSRLVGPGQKFSTLGSGARGSVEVAGASSGGHGTNKFTDQFLAFSFQDNGHNAFGWLEASLTDTTFNDLTVNVVAFAFDPSGAQVPTGQTSSVPEPGPEIVSAALAALTLGAAGVRRLKAKIS